MSKGQVTKIRGKKKERFEVSRIRVIPKEAMLRGKQLMFLSFVLFYDVFKIKKVKGLRNNQRQVKDDMVGATV